MPDEEATLGERMREWATGRSWWWRALLFILLAFQVLKPLRERGDWTVFSGIIFGAHEFGHLFFSFGGEWIAVAGGSLMQLLVPIGAAAVVYRSRDWFGIAACGAFLATSMAELSWYIADARNEMMDLVSFSPDGAVHDWNYLLGSLGWLEHDIALGRFMRLLAWCVLIASALMSARLFYWMATLKPREESAS